MIYLDDSSTTQLDSRVLDAMMPYLTEFYGNASSIHSFGQKSKFAIDEARYEIAKYLNCTPQEIIFTATGSESISLAIKGIAEYLAYKNGAYKPEHVYIVTGPMEHSSVHKTIAHMAIHGYKNRTVDVDENGLIYLEPVNEKEEFVHAIPSEHFPEVRSVNINKPKSLREVLSEIKKYDPEANIIVTIQYVNSEIGAIQDIKAITSIAHEFDAVVHTDAMQAAKLLALNVNDLGVDLLTMAAHKIYGPLGAALLYLKSGSKIARQIDGGEQEYNIRAGTQNTSVLVGFGKAVSLLSEERESRLEKATYLSENFISKLKELLPSIRILCEDKRMKSIVSVFFPKIKSTEFLVRLDIAGIMASAGSACNSGSLQPTKKLMSIGLSENDINSVIRFSIGKNNTEEEINEACEIIAREYNNYVAS